LAVIIDALQRGKNKPIAQGYVCGDTDAADPYIDDRTLRRQLKDQAYQAYLATMPEGNVRKMFLHRKGTPGFSLDRFADNEIGLRTALHSGFKVRARNTT
jgi:hypothetical protein